MIQINGLNKSLFGGGHRVNILNGIDLVIPSGQFIAITGASGSGKTTLLSLIAGLDEPTEGNIIINGQNITKFSEDELAELRSQHFGFVFLFAGIIFTTVIAVTPPSYWERQVSLTKWQDSSIGRRQAYLIVGWQSFKEHPFLGSGTGTFRDLYSKSNYARVFAKEGSTTRRFAHNTYVEVLVGSGILGFLINQKRKTLKT